MKHLPDEQSILAMGDMELTCLAWQMGLAPCGYVMRRNVIVHESYTPDKTRWNPAEDIREAREIFLDKLPAMGYSVSIDWDAVFSYGRVQARYRTSVCTATYGSEQWKSRPRERTEAMALLRCACLIVAEHARANARKNQKGVA